jgi:hypothetical protein
MKLFYSWQSDRPGKTGRHFIREALEVAVRDVATDIKTEAADRPELDHDTKGIPGSPDLANTILEKIRASALFIADVTPVGVAEDGKLIINPNVAIELGYALAVIGTKALLMIMNGAYGTREDLPFDLRHKRGPIFYNLSGDADRRAIEAAKKQLAAELKVAIRACLSALPTEPAAETFSETPPAATAAQYFPTDGTLVERTGVSFRDRVTGSRPLLFSYAPGALLYLRVIPSREARLLNGVEVSELIRHALLGPLRIDGIDGYSSHRNRYGGVIYAGNNETGRLFTSTQLFPNRELWGIDWSCLQHKNSRPNVPGEFPVIPSLTYERILFDSLRRYRDFARDVLRLTSPLTVEAGAVGVDGFYMAVDGRYMDPWWGPVYGDIKWRGSLKDFDDRTMHSVLLDIFNSFFAACGHKRPENLNGFPPPAARPK